MSEHYEDIVHNGVVVGQRLVTDAPPVPLTDIQRADLLARLTPTELHAWRRACQRALDTNSPAAADRNALYAWARWESMNGVVDMSGEDIQGLKGVWVALGMTQARADELLAPITT
jgi:hypothetical protein